MVNIDFAKHFYDVYLNFSPFSESITYIDENGAESSIKALIYREGYGDGRKFRVNQLSNSRKIYIDIANSSVYGRANVKNNKDKVKLKRNTSDSSESTFIVSAVTLSDKSKIRLEIK